MAVGPRSEPLGGLAPLAAGPPAGVIGALLVWSGDEALFIAALGATAAAVLAALAAMWGARERRPARLFGRIVASMMLAGCVGAPAVFFALDVLRASHVQRSLWTLGELSALGAVIGLAYGIASGALLALMVRLHRGSGRAQLALLTAGAGWILAGVALLAWRARPHSLVMALLLGGIALAVLSALPRRAPSSSVDSSGDVDAAPSHATRRWVDALHLLGPGLLLGLLVLERVIPASMMPRTMLDLLLAGLAPALLAALAGAWSMRAVSPSKVGGRAFVSCTIAGVLCAPLTYLVLAGAHLCSDYAGTRFDLEMLGLVSVMGGAIGVPAGLVLGVLFGAALASIARLCRGMLALPIGRASLGALWIAAGIAAPLAELVLEPAPTSHAVAGASAVVLALGLLLGASPALHLARALHLLRRARRGGAREHVVVLPSELDVDEATFGALPAYLPFGRTDAVLVRRLDPEHAPFRDASVSELVALVAAPRGSQRG